MERYRSGYPVTAHDTNLSIRAGDCTDALYIGGAGGGGLHVTMEDGQELTLAGVTAGYHRLAVKKVWATGTTVTGIAALKS